MTANSLHLALTALVSEVLERELDIDPDASLLEAGLDSINFVRLAVLIEERFGLRLDDEDLVPDNFSSITRLADLLAARGFSAEAAGVAADTREGA